jgi:hypothetical protein
VIEGFHNDNLQSFKLFDDYPSHLHIDLSPRAQGSLINLKNKQKFLLTYIGKGYGTKMIQHIENELQRRGSKGVHLGRKDLILIFNLF